MKKELARVKKYRTFLNFIVGILFTLASTVLAFFIAAIDYDNEPIYLILVFPILVFLFLISWNIQTFISQKKFNKSTPEYYITEVNNDAVKINGNFINFEDIVSIEYYKIYNFGIFGETKEPEVLLPVGTLFNWEKKLYTEIQENSIKKAKKRYFASVEKSKIGKIIIKLNSTFLVLKRVYIIDETLMEFFDFLKEKGIIIKKKTIKK